MKGKVLIAAFIFALLFCASAYAGVYAISNGNVYKFSEGTNSWVNLGKPGNGATVINAKGSTLIARAGTDIYAYSNAAVWELKGSMGSSLGDIDAMYDSSIGRDRWYSLNGNTVYMNSTGTANDWASRGSPGDATSEIEAGNGDDVFAVAAPSYSAFSYLNSGGTGWTEIGRNDTVSKLDSFGGTLVGAYFSTAYKYNNSYGWTDLGRPAGFLTTVAAVATDGSIYWALAGGDAYRYSSGSWPNLGNPGSNISEIHAFSGKVYARKGSDNTLYRYDSSWVQLGSLSAVTAFSAGPAIANPNQPPAATNVNITPSPAYDANTLTCNYTYTDPEGNPEGTSTYRWAKNGTWQTGQTTKTLNANNTTTGDNW
ncbi:MAG: hypothetical protein V1494_03075, partial [Candidatus Diapherotrites archaeon]